jgi:hypothetical protein
MNVIQLTYLELEDLFLKYYGKEFDYLDDSESYNNCWLAFSVSQKEPLERYYLDAIEDFKNGDGYKYITFYLLQNMVNNDALAPGVYLIQK